MLKIFKNVGRGTKTFIPCVRDRCYCLELINKPDKTKITNKLLIILSPFVPFLAEELWQEIGYDKTVYDQNWTAYNKDYLAFNTYTLVIQVNGKIRNRLDIELDTDLEKMKEIALNDEKTKQWIEGKEIIKVIPIKNSLVNIVVKG